MLALMKILAAVFLAATAMAQTSLSAEDRAEIQGLMSKYGQALGGCRAEEFADLFTADGVFASGFRGRMAGRDRLIKLVQSERQCTAPNGKGAGRLGRGRRSRLRWTATLCEGSRP
jgi:hypothetical protein